MILILHMIMRSIPYEGHDYSICSIHTHRKTVLLLFEELCSAKETEDENSRRED